jgi:hypothetical protein
MGFGSFFKDLGKKIKHGLDEAAEGIKTGFKKIEHPLEVAEQKVEKAVETVYNDGKDVVKWGGNQYDKNMDVARGLVSNLGSGAKDVLEGAGKGLGDIGTIAKVVAGVAVLGGGAWAYSTYQSSKSKQNSRKNKTKQNSRASPASKGKRRYFSDDEEEEEDCYCPKKGKKR